MPPSHARGVDGAGPGELLDATFRDAGLALGVRAEDVLGGREGGGRQQK